MADLDSSDDARRGFHVYTWSPLISSSTPTAVEVSGWTDKSVQMDGTWGSATIVLKGSNDNVTYFALTDPQGNSISKTADALEQITECTRWIKPTTSGGDGTQSVSIRVFCAKRQLA